MSNKWYDKNGGHEEGLSDDELKKDLRDLQGIQSLLKNGKITFDKFTEALNVLRPQEGGEPALGDMVKDRDVRKNYRAREMRRRGRKSFEDLGEER